jgi:cellulose biosynthesis protein BcsQ
MSIVAVYNIKGGVGKTTTAVNLSYLAATAGQRTLLWDLDLQAASSFAFRIRPRVAGFGRKGIGSSETLAEAIRETDYSQLDVLPADFTYRKMDRLLAQLGRPERVMGTLLDEIGRDYDTVFLDCPPGFSVLTQAVLHAADAVLVPTIPTVLSLRMVARLIKWATDNETSAEPMAFFSMVDRRKTLHCRACEWSRVYPEIFLTAQIPYASVVEQMAVRRMPLPVFAARDAATAAFAAVSAEVQARLQQGQAAGTRARDRWEPVLDGVQSLIGQLESAERQPRSSWQPTGPQRTGVPRSNLADSPLVDFVHRFDTDRGDLSRGGYVVELREREGNLMVVAARHGSRRGEADGTMRAEAQIDSSWAALILSGGMSPLEALERRLGWPAPGPLESVRAMVGGRSLRRVDSRVVGRGAPSPHRPS